MPKRIQRKRTKGWRMPVGAIYVGRPTRWGNPYGSISPFPHAAAENPPATVLEAYRIWIKGQVRLDPNFLTLLRGKDLACWCPLVDENGNPVPCHADILLEMANQ